MTSEKKFDQIKYQNEYNRKNYDHINIMVAKGLRRQNPIPPPGHANRSA